MMIKSLKMDKRGGIIKEDAYDQEYQNYYPSYRLNGLSGNTIKNNSKLTKNMPISGVTLYMTRLRINTCKNQKR